jgi:hypothetical protein
MRMKCFPLSTHLASQSHRAQVPLALYHHPQVFPRIHARHFYCRNHVVHTVMVKPDLQPMPRDRWLHSYSVRNRKMVICRLHHIWFSSRASWTFYLHPIFLLTALKFAYEARKSKKIIGSRDISYAFTNVMANHYYSLRMSALLLPFFG